MKMQYGKTVVSLTARLCRLGTAVLAVVFTSGTVLPLAAGEDLSSSAEYGTIHLNTSGQPFVVSSQADLGVLADDWPVTYRRGETVAVFSPGGGRGTLIADAASASGAVAFSPTVGGLWRLVNSNGESAYVGVSWSVFDDGWALNSAGNSPIALRTDGYGANRTLTGKGPVSVAYSGDNWAGNAMSVSTLTVRAPSGTQVDYALSGTGALPFSPAEYGDWVLTLVYGGRTLVSAVRVSSPGTIISVR